MIVKDIMVTDVKTITPESTIQEAATSMRKFDIGSLLVVEKTKMVGILTEGNILDKVVAEANDPATVSVRDVMSTNIIYIRPDLDVGEAADLMVEKKIKRLPVVSGGRLVGIVTAMDICAAEPKMVEQVTALLMLGKKKQVAG
ncbi:MAG: CBS domain-containing protein [Candidatus Aenigmarchaeota archaeon]|nr:CBS domain-containing protein [Candidatus Aenigmarchaeota archaeon]